MVLEAIITASGARRNPLGMLVLSFVLSSVAIWISYFTFPDSASILALAFVTIGFMPIIHRLFTLEEELEMQKPGWCGTFLARHFSIIMVYAFFFIGVVASYAFWYVMLPDSAPAVCAAADDMPIECMMPVRDSVFAAQEQTWQGISNLRDNSVAKIIGFVTGRGVGSCLGPEREVFGCAGFLFGNNALVLGLAVLFSFLYGAGAIFLLSWNASVIGLFIGKEIVETHLLAGVLRAIGYLPHGFLEIGAYFIGAVAGGIISVAISKRKYRTHEFETIAKDALVLLIIAYAVLLLAALVEGWLIVSVG